MQERSRKNILDDALNLTVELLIITTENDSCGILCISERRAHVRNDHQFGLFQDGEDGRLWRKSFADLDEAKRNARKLADEERQEFFVCRFEDYSEIARVFPPRIKPRA